MPKLCVEYSKSGRAKCSNTSCGKKIEKHELRIGTEVILPFIDEEVETWKWRHLCCFTERQLSNAKASGDLDTIKGENDLAPEDKAMLQKMRDGQLVDDLSILGRIGHFENSPAASRLPSKPGKAAKPTGKQPAGGHVTPATSSTPGEKRARAPARMTKVATVKHTDAEEDGVDSEATEEYEVAVETVSGKLKCPYGKGCFRTNPEHFELYEHDDSTAAGGDGATAAPAPPTTPKLKPVIKRKK